MYINIFKIKEQKKIFTNNLIEKINFLELFHFFIFGQFWLKKNNKKYQLTKYGYICLLLNLIYMYIFENM